MAIIPFVDLSYGTDMAQDYRPRRVQFDEGISQRSKRLNGAPQKWRLVWNNFPEQHAETLRQFFEGLQAVDIINWTPFGQGIELKWTADGFQSKPSGFRRMDVSVTLMQEFDL